MFILIFIDLTNNELLAVYCCCHLFYSISLVKKGETSETERGKKKLRELNIRGTSSNLGRRSGGDKWGSRDKGSEAESATKRAQWTQRLKIGTQHIRLFRRNLSTPLTAKTFLSFSSSAESLHEKRLWHGKLHMWWGSQRRPVFHLFKWTSEWSKCSSLRSARSCVKLFYFMPERKGQNLKEIKSAPPLFIPLLTEIWAAITLKVITHFKSRQTFCQLDSLIVSLATTSKLYYWAPNQQCSKSLGLREGVVAWS